MSAATPSAGRPCVYGCGLAAEPGSTTCPDCGTARNMGGNPFEPGDTWARPRNKRAARAVDRLADAIDKQERAAAKLRRAFRAWDKASETVNRLNKCITRDNPEG